MMIVEPVVLEGAHVRLEPLTREHAPGLLAAAADSSVFEHTIIAGLFTLAEAEAYIAEASRPTHEGGQAPFAIIDRASGEVAGSTRYLAIVPQHRGLEIGWTWLAPRFQRTAVNTECKLLLLTHAFETLGAIRVQLKTDIRNERSQRAIERIGATREGVLRATRIRRDGSYRDTVMYSIIASEWPAVKVRLTGLLRSG